MKELHYKDIALVPRFSNLESRSNADVSVNFCGYIFNIPVIPANMATTIDFAKAEMLADNRYFYILHRFYDYPEILSWIHSMNENYPHSLVSISLGVQAKDYNFVEEIVKLKYKVHFITIDIAHGYSVLMEKMARFIKVKLPSTKLIIGNVFGDADSMEFCYKLKADAVKIGLSYGAACTTYDKTGFASPMFSCGERASSYKKVYKRKMQLIGDGGIRTHGDIAKALRAGYDMVMIGGLFASCIDSPASLVCGKKLYYGSASARNKGHKNNIEGREILLDCNNMTYIDKLKEMQQDLQSAISYAGGKDLNSLKQVEIIKI